MSLSACISRYIKIYMKDTVVKEITKAVQEHFYTKRVS